MKTKVKINIDEKIKELEDAKKAWNYMRASFICEQIIQSYLNNNKNKVNDDSISKYKIEFRELNIKAWEQMKEIHIETQVPNDKIEQIIKSILDDQDINNFFKKVSVNLNVKKSEIKDIASSNSPVFLQIAHLSTITQKGDKLKQTDSTNDYWYNQIYGIQLWIKKNLLSLVFDRWIIEWKLTFIKLQDCFLNKWFFPSIWSFMKFNTWLERYFEWDQISSLHILVPLLEEIIINLSFWMWIDVIGINNKWGDISSQDKTLWTNLILSEPFQQKWWEDFCYLLDYILFSSYWYKLRHKIAHWEVLFEECSFENATIVLCLYIFIANWIRFNNSI